MRNNVWCKLTAEDEKRVQLISAKITGNFKRGNEHF